MGLLTMLFGSKRSSGSSRSPRFHTKHFRRTKVGSDLFGTKRSPVAGFRTKGRIF